MEDREFLLELIKRLFGHFYEGDSGGAHCVLTDSEASADALEETLFNLGFGSAYERVDKVNDNGIWEARFIVKDNDNDDVAESKETNDEECRTRTEYRVKKIWVCNN